MDFYKKQFFLTSYFINRNVRRVRCKDLYNTAFQLHVLRCSSVFRGKDIMQCPPFEITNTLGQKSCQKTNTDFVCKLLFFVFFTNDKSSRTIITKFEIDLSEDFYLFFYATT